MGTATLIQTRAALSALAWETARWHDGRRVVLAPLQMDMAMQGPTCRVLPAPNAGSAKICMCVA
jgi:hypothetical protein